MDEDTETEHTPSEREAFYDKEVAPVLLDLANKCGERGLHFLAQVEFEPGLFGFTRKFADNPHLAMLMLDICARSRENIDAYIINLLRFLNQEGIDYSNSMILRQYSGKGL